MFKSGKIFKQKKEETNLLPFQVIDGGLAEPKLAGKEPPHEDWLTPMTPNTIFLAKEKNNRGSVCTEFMVLNHSEKCVKLEATGSQFWVVPGNFCNGMDLIDVLQRGYAE